MTTPSHAPGSVDVVVTNVDGQNAVAIGAYTFAAPESFDVNGNWRGVSFVGDSDEPFTFTVVNGAVVEHHMRDVRVGDAVAAGPNHPR